MYPIFGETAICMFYKNAINAHLFRWWKNLEVKKNDILYEIRVFLIQPCHTHKLSLTTIESVMI